MSKKKLKEYSKRLQGTVEELRGEKLLFEKGE